MGLKMMEIVKNELFYDGNVIRVSIFIFLFVIWKINIIVLIYVVIYFKYFYFCVWWKLCLEKVVIVGNSFCILFVFDIGWWIIWDVNS